MNMLAPQGAVIGAYDVIVLDDFLLVVRVRRLARHCLKGTLPRSLFAAILSRESMPSIGRTSKPAWCVGGIRRVRWTRQCVRGFTFAKRDALARVRLFGGRVLFGRSGAALLRRVCDVPR